MSNLDERIASDEYCRYIEQSNAEIQAELDAWDERLAIELELLDDGKTTGQRALDALDALDRKEQFPGERDVARAWLRHYEPTLGRFRRPQ